MPGLCRQTPDHCALVRAPGRLSRWPRTVLLRLCGGLLAGALWWLPAHATVEANSAPPADLMAIKGIGPATSQKIVAAREQAPFTDWADLVRRVKGVGQKTAVKMSDSGLRVNGQPWPQGSAAATQPPQTRAPTPPAGNTPAAVPPATRAPTHLPTAPRWNSP